MPAPNHKHLDLLITAQDLHNTTTSQLVLARFPLALSSASFIALQDNYLIPFYRGDLFHQTSTTQMSKCTVTICHIRQMPGLLLGGQPPLIIHHPPGMVGHNSDRHINRSKKTPKKNKKKNKYEHNMNLRNTCAPAYTSYMTTHDQVLYSTLIHLSSDTILYSAFL